MSFDPSKTYPGVNIQVPWSQLIIGKKKTVETRHYPLPSHLVGKEILIIETPGKVGTFKRRVIGIVVFGESFEYRNEKHFSSDIDQHLVSVDHPSFSWAAAKGNPKWGWPVLSVEKVSLELPSTFKAGIIFTKNVPAILVKTT